MYEEVVLPQDNYQAGLIIGERSRRIMHEYVLNSKPWQTLKAWMGSERLKNMESAARSTFPLYVEELEGIANGCNLPFSHIFLWNCRGDLFPFISEGCTTVYIPSPEGMLLGHNEDGDPGFRKYCFISKREPEGDNLGFTSFTYPASINGHAFAVNSAGLTQLINNIRSLEYGDGVPRQLLSRAILDCRCLDDALSVLNGCHRSGSFHHTLAQVGQKDVLSIEYTPNDVSVLRLHSAYGHANHFIHPRFHNSRQRVTLSSAARQASVDELCRKLPSSPRLDDIRRMLCSADNPDLPIYRTNPNDPDRENTLATVLLLIKPNVVQSRLYGAGDKEQAFACEMSEKAD
jgi:hypothetical protein